MKARHLQRTYSARETDVMQELDIRNLTGITSTPPLIFLSSFEEISYKLSLLNALLIGFKGLLNSEVPGVKRRLILPGV